MNLRKRILALLMAFIMVLTYMPALAFADTVPSDAAGSGEGGGVGKDIVDRFSNRDRPGHLIDRLDRVLCPERCSANAGHQHGTHKFLDVLNHDV